MTIDAGGTYFSGVGSICRIALAAALLGGALLPAGGCASTTNNTTPTAVTEGPKDTGTYPNLNVPPPVAAKQLTKEETAAKLAQLKADQQAQLGKGGAAKATSQTTLNTLAKTHGSDTLKQIEGKCDPALDPTCK